MRKALRIGALGDIATWRSIIGDSALTSYLNEDCWNYLKRFISLDSIPIHNELGLNETLRLFYPYNMKDCMEDPLPIGNVMRDVAGLVKLCRVKLPRPDCPSRNNDEDYMEISECQRWTP